MEINIDPQPFIDGILMGLEWGLSIAWTIIDTIIFIELNNPAGEIAIFVGLITATLAAYKLIPALIQRYVFDNGW